MNLIDRLSKCEVFVLEEVSIKSMLSFTTFADKMYYGGSCVQP